jgi:hypothetical protein
MKNLFHILIIFILLPGALSAQTKKDSICGKYKQETPTMYLTIVKNHKVEFQKYDLEGTIVYGKWKMIGDTIIIKYVYETKEPFNKKIKLKNPYQEKYLWKHDGCLKPLYDNSDPFCFF